ncbi:hypothetical protein HOC37_03150 [bacterium]|jgi:hypothetical protein|nr:hypothetical protein [bacterium]MBT3580958.1 hypothetical protein [bacterium]MBT4551964.1 hypothetical protein [bacterium]MBT5988534.1 hypothetical protein [bacterium]MBT7087417.1 hypothetical protein [bacterium]
MEYNAINQFIKVEQIKNTITFKPQVKATVHFTQLLNHVISRNQIVAVIANEKTEKDKLKKEKDVLEDGKSLKEEDDDGLTVYKTVQKIEERLTQLARVERQFYLGSQVTPTKQDH